MACSERRADLPDRIVGPELSKGGEVTLVDGVAVARHKIADEKLVFNCLQTFFQRSHRFAPINCSNKTFDITTPSVQAREPGPRGSLCSIQ